MRIPERIIFWDWNGTLLDDARTCMNTMNQMLERRNMPLLNLELYKEVFSFPVIEYYKKIGFDFNRESFKNLSLEFIDAYNLALGSAPLVGGAKKVLEYFKGAGRKNIIVSAMKQDMLERSVHEKKIGNLFTDILGIDNIYAASKSEMAISYVEKEGLDISDILFIGDTEHDYEVAEEIGCRCILIADGHQSEERLRATGTIVLPSLTSLLDAILTKNI